MQPKAEATPAAEVDGGWRHIANEWADVATSGLQWLRNIKGGASTVDAALANMEEIVRGVADQQPKATQAEAGEREKTANELMSFVDGDHLRGCEGRNYSCSCGYDETKDKLAAKAATLLRSPAPGVGEVIAASLNFLNHGTRTRLLDGDVVHVCKEAEHTALYEAMEKYLAQSRLTTEQRGNG